MPQTFSKLSDDQLNPVAGDSRLRIPEIEAWIGTLPLADVGETYQRVFSALLNINESDFPGQERFEALELFRRPIRYLSEALKHQFIGAPFPLTHKAHGIATQLRDLHMEMAKGYQIISDELLALTTLRQDFKLLATSLYRSLYYLGQGLLTSYQIYEPGTNPVWRRIHRIYEAAERKGMQSSVVKDDYLRSKPATSIEEQYKQILLLALANPYRYSQADMVSVYSLLEHWTRHCQLHPADHPADRQYACLVDLAGDHGPSYIAYNTVPHPTTCRFLDTTALIQLLLNSSPKSAKDTSNQTSGAEAPKKTTVTWKDLLQTLVTAWGLTTKRRFSRTRPEATNIGVSLSLSAIHKVIDNPDSIHADQTAVANIRSNISTARSAGVEGRVFSCEVINESADGWRLKWHNTNKGRIRVGELVAVHHTQDSGETSGIAVIRWLKNTGKHTVDFGIQLLTPNAIPIAIRHYGAKHPESGHEYLKGLYIPEFKSTRQPASLILPAFLYHADDIVSLIMDHEEHCLRLAKPVETTQGFSRFQFASMAVPQERRN